MNFWTIFPTICGYERVSPDRVRLYVEGPTAEPRFDRPRGVRTGLFRLYSGGDADAVLKWLDGNKAWQVLRVPPPLTTRTGMRAVLVASKWNCGEASALFGFARDRMVADEAHRHRLQREVRTLITSVIENPVKAGELQDLQTLEDVVNVSPVGVELATSAEVGPR